MLDTPSSRMRIGCPSEPLVSTPPGCSPRASSVEDDLSVRHRTADSTLAETNPYAALANDPAAKQAVEKAERKAAKEGRKPTGADFWVAYERLAG